jgi:hypothetical protein
MELWLFCFVMVKSITGLKSCPRCRPSPRDYNAIKLESYLTVARQDRCLCSSPYPGFTYGYSHSTTSWLSIVCDYQGLFATDHG